MKSTEPESRYRLFEAYVEVDAAHADRVAEDISEYRQRQALPYIEAAKREMGDSFEQAVFTRTDLGRKTISRETAWDEEGNATDYSCYEAYVELLSWRLP